MIMEKKNQAIINSLNQRASSMLSFDYLVEVNTVPEEAEEFLRDAMSNRKSVIIGASPNAAGKTTVMGALLGIRPQTEKLLVLEGNRDQDFEKVKTIPKNQKHCVIAHEIGSGSWYGYIWGRSVKRYLQLPQQHPKCALASNLHCDTFEEVYSLFQGFGITDVEIRQIDLFIFLKMEYREGIHRFINTIWEKTSSQEYLATKQTHKRLHF